MEKTVAQRTSELEKKVGELEKINSVMVDREIKMTELKKQLNESSKIKSN